MVNLFHESYEVASILPNEELKVAAVDEHCFNDQFAQLLSETNCITWQGYCIFIWYVYDHGNAHLLDLLYLELRWRALPIHFYIFLNASVIIFLPLSKQEILTPVLPTFKGRGCWIVAIKRPDPIIIKWRSLARCRERRDHHACIAKELTRIHVEPPHVCLKVKETTEIARSCQHVQEAAGQLRHFVHFRQAYQWTE